MSGNLGSTAEFRNRLSTVLSRNPTSDKNYYAVTMLGHDNGMIGRSFFTHWEGFADDDYRIELRAPSIVNADKVADLWRHDLNQTCMIIESEDDLFPFLRFGGNALIEKSVANHSLPSSWMEPRECAKVGFLGFEDLEFLPKGTFNRAPSPKLRMQVLKRDSRRCQICGRRPEDHTDVELHVHHIRPWGSRGLTHERNLITLCHTCHKGLDPHYDLSLFQLLEPKERNGPRSKKAEAYYRGMQLYHEIFMKSFMNFLASNAGCSDKLPSM